MLIDEIDEKSAGFSEFIGIAQARPNFVTPSIFLQNTLSELFFLSISILLPFLELLCSLLS
ncbi:hypothetical protein EHE19_013480 [Ruminiclostridium herbifermentans]|uniref:Uncharacterized protein n=1 Tax=Ruminiclostridium herbifermentans TaxID=2488810 RepID=A0A7H1VKI4_9FIRM|nr:hypothetical protein EHE19_013480 [Ruminiclostridium herbifermentans]